MISPFSFINMICKLYEWPSSLIIGIKVCLCMVQSKCKCTLASVLLSSPLRSTRTQTASQMVSTC